MFRFFRIDLLAPVIYMVSGIGRDAKSSTLQTVVLASLKVAFPISIFPKYIYMYTI